MELAQPGQLGDNLSGQDRADQRWLCLGLDIIQVSRRSRSGHERPDALAERGFDD
jgi:hypothetical protein